MPHLFDPFTLRGVTCRNRIGISPMCQYSARDGHPTEWHHAHLGARAAGGAGLVIVEATAVEARGRISFADAGIWSDSHILSWKPIAQFIASQGAVPAIQLAHAGWKASTDISWNGGKQLPLDDPRAWEVIGPSPIAFGAMPRAARAMTSEDIAAVRRAFVQAARRAIASGFAAVELHAAHGYLFHSFLSPLSNQRTDTYGGSFENRTRFLRETVDAVRAVIPESAPLLVRFSCTDWVEGGWTIDDSVALARLLGPAGVDLIDCSSGGAVPGAKIPVGPHYQAPLAAQIRRDAGIATAAVGMITEPAAADGLIHDGAADLVLIARASLREPNWPIRAAKELGQPLPAPPQYLRAW